MFIVPEKYNIVLTFSPIEEITGHWFEVFEYYWLFKDAGFRPYMLFHSPNISFDEVCKALEEKYTLPVPKNDMMVLTEREKFIGCPNAVALVCDGNFFTLDKHNIKILAKKILGFGCGDVSIPRGLYDGAEYLLDKRVYNTISYGIDYAKKIYADILREPTTKKNNTLFYLTKNCRRLSLERVQEIIDDLQGYDEHIIVSPDDYYQSLRGNVRIVRPPMRNMFNEFDTYIYTPVPRHFDCSPRLIAECALFDRRVEYYDIDYFDVGLETRKKDIESGIVWMKKDDELIEIVEKYL